MRMALDRIVRGKRLRPVNPARVQMFVENPKALDQPITVRPFKDAPAPADHELVAGLHRFEAAHVLGRRDIPVLVELYDDNEAILAQIDENLIREELSTLDRAVFLTERKRVWEALHPAAKQGGDRRSTARQEEIKRQTLPVGFSRAAAEAVGLSERTIRDAVALVAALGPELTAKLQATPIAGNAVELKALAKLGEKDRERAAEQIVSGKAQNLTGALKAIGRGKPKVDADEQILRSLIALWGRAGARAKKRFMAHAGLETTADEGRGRGGVAARDPRSGNRGGHRGKEKPPAA